MRAASTLVLALALVSSSAAHARSQKPPKVLSAQLRGQIAEQAVHRALVGWTRPGAIVTVRAGVVPFNGDARNPITGQGPVEVFVEQHAATGSGLWQNLISRFARASKQRYLVHVGEGGSTGILERVSLAPQYRVARFITDKLQLRGLFADFYRSSRAGEGLWTAIGASGAIPFSPALSGALFMRLAQVVREGIASQSVVRDQAMDDTVAWANAEQQKSRQWPTLMETYRAYTDRIQHLERGVRPVELGVFAAELSIRQL